MPYNGHRSRAYWNVSLWINNDEGLYNLARECVRRTRTRRSAAEMMHAALVNDYGVTQTRDGYTYSVPKIQAALVGIQ